MRKWQKIQRKINLEACLDPTNPGTLHTDWCSHVQHLQEAHRVLELKLSEMQQHTHVDENSVAELKKLKLKYKDEIARLNQHKDMS